jgi:crotonobetainyl-CoA:carnitine CoA-transferase CaiB-like acyl-CoA transferase
MIERTNTQPLPLSGIRVIDYTHFLAGPHMSRCLASLGAEVIKVERPKAGDAGRAHPIFVDGQSGYFLQQNMGKQGLCVDLKDSRGLELLHKLVETADVFVENYRPGALDKLGLGYAELSRINPGLIYCSISAYGHTGPDSHRAGFGLIAEAKSGCMAQLGSPGEAPPLLRMPIGDMYAAMHGVAAVCASLYSRQATGKGRHVDLALYDCLISMHDYAVQRYTLSGGKEIPVQTGSVMPDSTLYGAFAAKDGNVVIAAQVDEAWKRLALLIGGDELASDKRFLDPASRNANHAAAESCVREWVKAQPSARACIAALDVAEVPCALVQRIDEVLADPQVAARNMVVEQDHPILGKVKLANLPFRFSDCDTTPKTAAPLLGQHNRQIAAALGYSPAEIDRMVNHGVLYSENAASQPQAHHRVPCEHQPS